MYISVVENHIKLWRILAGMKLTYLAIESCVLVPWEDDTQAESDIIVISRICKVGNH